MTRFIENFRIELQSKVSLVLWGSISLVILVAGPFGTYQTMSFIERFLVGLPSLSVLMMLGVGVRAAVFRPLVKRDYRTATIATAIAAILVLVPGGLAILRIVGQDSFFNLPSILELSLLIGSLSLGHSSLRQEQPAADAKPASFLEVPAQVAEPLNDMSARLLHRLEPDQRGSLMAISVRDHYVDVQTCRGKASLLLRFGDAMAEVDPDAGTQVHRSHWVAWDAVETVEREGVKMFLKLKHGARIPVSKNHRDKLELRGII